MPGEARVREVPEKGGIKMRLVDADALKETTLGHGAKIAYVASFVWDIDAAPTVEAIPVEWIKALTNHSDMFTRGAAKWVLGCWKKEQEAR